MGVPRGEVAGVKLVGCAEVAVAWRDTQVGAQSVRSGNAQWRGRDRRKDCREEGLL